MDILEQLDAFIDDAVAELWDPIQASILLLSEGFLFTPEILVETVRRRKRKVAGAGTVVLAKTGRADPRLRQAAIRRMRNPQTKMKIRRSKQKATSKLKAQRTRQARKRIAPSKRRAMKSRIPRTSYRGYHGAKRHAAPRRSGRR